MCGFWTTIRSRDAFVPRSSEIAAARVKPAQEGPDPILPGQHYFAVTVNEIYLSKGREWWTEYDPLVLALTEFTYDSAHVSLPFVVGPKLLDGKVADLPQGMIYRNTRVAGIHPFRGGRVTTTMVLCKVRRRDYARELVKFIEAVAGAVPFAADLATYTRLAKPLMNGIETLLGFGETTPLVGIRQEFDHDCGDPIRPAYFALIDAPETKYPIEQLSVRDGRLFSGRGEEQIKEIRSDNYVLFSIRSAEALTDLAVMPFHTTAEGVISLAASDNEQDWMRAKAELVVLLRELLSSPDLTMKQAMSYHESVIQRAKEARARATSIKNLRGKMQPITSEPIQSALRSAAEILDLP